MVHRGGARSVDRCGGEGSSEALSAGDRVGGGGSFPGHGMSTPVCRSKVPLPAPITRAMKRAAREEPMARRKQKAKQSTSATCQLLAPREKKEIIRLRDLYEAIRRLPRHYHVLAK